MHDFVKKLLIYVSILLMSENVYAAYVSLVDIGLMKLTEQSTLIKQSKSCGQFYVLRNNFSELDTRNEYEQFFSFGGEQVLKYRRKGLLFKKKPTGDLSYKTPYG